MAMAVPATSVVVASSRPSHWATPTPSPAAAASMARSGQPAGDAATTSPTDGMPAKPSPRNTGTAVSTGEIMSQPANMPAMRRPNWMAAISVPRPDRIAAPRRA
jgi:hypothetical protein